MLDMRQKRHKKLFYVLGRISLCFISTVLIRALRVTAGCETIDRFSKEQDSIFLFIL